MIEITFSGRTRAEVEGQMRDYFGIQEPRPVRDPIRLDEAEALVSKPVREILDELPVRAYNVFDQWGVKSMADLLRLREADLLRMKHLGRKTLWEIKGALEHLNLELGMGDPDDADHEVAEAVLARVNGQ